MSKSLFTRKSFVKGLAGGALTFAGLVGAGFARADEAANGPSVAAIYLGVEKQAFVEKDGDTDHLDTVWVYFDDMTFTQYVFDDDAAFVFSTGTYKFEDNGSFNYDAQADAKASITITREQKYNATEGLAPYDSVHTYDLGTLGYLKIFPLENAAAPDPNAEFVGLPNPWSEVASADEAASGAGFDEFDVPETLEEYGLGRGYETIYRCMKGIAEVRYELGAARITVRKGSPVEGDDISGDYNQYALTWTQDIDDDLIAICSGNQEDKAIKIIWENDGFDYSINCEGLGGDSDYGLDAQVLAELVDDID